MTSGLACLELRICPVKPQAAGMTQPSAGPADTTDSFREGGAEAEAPPTWVGPLTRWLWGQGEGSPSAPLPPGLGLLG